MKCRHTALTTVLGLLIGFSWGISSWSAQQSASGTVPVNTVVSVEARHGKDIPVVNREDVRVFEGRNRLQVTEWIPLQGDQSSLELFVLIDLPNLAASEHTVVRDFPAGTERYYVDAQGYEMVVVNGVPAMERGKHTGALPGEVLRGA